MDPDNLGKEAIVKVTDWLRGIWEMRRRNSPIQQWVDSIPSPTKSNLTVSRIVQQSSVQRADSSLSSTEPKDIPFSMSTKYPSMTVSAPVDVPNSPGINATGLPNSLPHNKLVRDPSLQSDSSHCSSVESLLELRRADPEAILLGLGFGGCSNTPQDNGPLSRIPKRFLQPSKLKGIAINDFVKHQQETGESFDSVALGYRGLTGSPYIAPSEIVQKIMDRLREHDSHEIDLHAYNYCEPYSPLLHNVTQSVLSPDNRQFLERPRSKSPDMRNKRMIIGQKSFAFGHDGDLIEIEPTKSAQNSNKDQSTIEDSERVESCELKTKYIHEHHIQLAESRDDKSRQLPSNDSLNFNDIDSNVRSSASNPIDGLKLIDENKTESAKISGSYINRDENAEINCKRNSTVQKCSSDVRRASEGFCNVESSERCTEGRRHSDGSVRDTETNNNESSLLQKRRTLKRQSRISDADSNEYCSSFETIGNEGAASRPTRQPRSPQGTVENIELLSGMECLGASTSTPCRAKCLRSIQKEKGISEDDIQNIEEDEQCCAREQAVEDKDQTEDDSKEKSCTDCCCHVDKTKYWKEMKKILRENKKLGSLVARSNREMAEIREMLSSVLSVRMEPGF